MNANFIVIFTGSFRKLFKFWFGFSNSAAGSGHRGLRLRCACAEQQPLLKAAQHTGLGWTAPISSPARPGVTSWASFTGWENTVFKGKLHEERDQHSPMVYGASTLQALPNPPRSLPLRYPGGRATRDDLVLTSLTGRVGSMLGGMLRLGWISTLKMADPQHHH